MRERSRMKYWGEFDLRSLAKHLREEKEWLWKADNSSIHSVAFTFS